MTHIKALSDRQARRIDKLRALGDPERNPEKGEAKAAREKSIDLLYEAGMLHDSIKIEVREGISEEDLRDALQKLCPNIDMKWVKITVESNQTPLWKDT